MAEDSVLNSIASEFKLWGVKFEQRHLGSGHIELTWQVTPDKEVRRTVLPKTGSDWRGWLNQRANVRRLFKQDGLSLKEKPKPEPILHKALAITPPKPPQDRPEDQMKAMRAEIGELTELVLELGGIVAELRDELKNKTPPVEVPAFLSPQPAPPPELFLVPKLRQRAPNTRRQKAISFLSHNWNSLDAISRDMGLDKAVVKRKLIYLATQGKAELNNGLWRKPPEKLSCVKKIAPVGLVAKRPRGRPRLNGAH